MDQFLHRKELVLYVYPYAYVAKTEGFYRVFRGGNDASNPLYYLCLGSGWTKEKAWENASYGINRFFKKGE